MRLSILIAGVFAATTCIIASPTKHLFARGEAGNVLDATGTVYMLHDTDPGNVRVITPKLANGEFMRPVSFHIEQGHACKFYSEATRGIGYPLGEHDGLADGTFGDDWAAFYECWPVADRLLPKNPVIAVEPRDAPPATIEMIPCGYVRTSTGAQLSLDESGKQYLVDFRINGDSYTPTFYHISSNCICRFYSGDGGRSGPGMIVEAHGPAEDNFGEKKAVQYKCWIRT